MKTEVSYGLSPPPALAGFFRQTATGALIFAQPCPEDTKKTMICWLYDGANVPPLGPRINVGNDHPLEWFGWHPLSAEATLHINP